jgi:hypothetical protein
LGVIFLIVVVLSIGMAPAASASSTQAPTNAPSASCAPVYYRVQYGDNLTRIAWRYGVTIWQLQQWNGISNPNRIYAGQTLVIYRCGYPPPPPAPCACYTCPCAPAPPPPPPPPPAPVPCGCYGCPCPVPPSPPSPPPGGCWNADYFNNRDLSGSVALNRCDADINFNWTGTSPAPGTLGPYNFSARWTRVFYMNYGTYRVTAASDDGVRVWIDGILVIDNWGIHPVTTCQRDVLIYAGNHTWTVEYFQAEGESVVQIRSQKVW